VLTSFWGAVFNPTTLPRFAHVITGSVLVGAFFVLSVSAYWLLRRRHVEVARKSMTIGLVFAFLFAYVQLGFGHWQGVRVHQTQPLKLAAVEGLFETTQGAPMLLFGWPDADAGATRMKIGVPKVLSLVVAGDPNAEVKGLKDFPRDEWPPLGLTFASFHLMVALGTFFLAFTALGMFLLWRKRLFDARWYLWVVALAVPLPFLADHAGWVAAEVGRQPWIVYGLLRTRDAISPAVPAAHILASIVLFSAIYVLLFSLWLYLLTQKIRKGPEPVTAAAGGKA
jgi:cytochrome d ubiquinol oxidase subunit I